jgi:exosome complex component RRP42
MAALLNAKLPKLEDGKVVRENLSGGLKIDNKTVTCTFAKIDTKTVLDPSLDEEKAMEARLTIATTPNHICAVQKGGKGGFLVDEVNELIDLSFKKGSELRKLIE